MSHIEMSLDEKKRKRRPQNRKKILLQKKRKEEKGYITSRLRPLEEWGASRANDFIDKDVIFSAVSIPALFLFFLFAFDSSVKIASSWTTKRQKKKSFWRCRCTQHELWR